MYVYVSQGSRIILSNKMTVLEPAGMRPLTSVMMSGILFSLTHRVGSNRRALVRHRRATIGSDHSYADCLKRRPVLLRVDVVTIHQTVSLKDDVTLTVSLNDELRVSLSRHVTYLPLTVSFKHKVTVHTLLPKPFQHDDYSQFPTK